MKRSASTLLTCGMLFGCLVFLMIPAVPACPAGLTLTSTPSATAVYFDGSYLGITPLNKTLLSGPHTLRLSYTGYYDYSASVNLICDGTTSQHFILDPIPLITTTPVPAGIPAQQLPHLVPAQQLPPLVPAQQLPRLVPAQMQANRVVPAYHALPQESNTPIPGRFTGTYPVGFSGLTFNADGRNTLDLDLAAAQSAGAEVTSYPDRIEIYQHNSPAVLITFRGNNFTIGAGKIAGTVSGADFATSPLPGTIPDGNISASARVQLQALAGRGELTTTIDTSIPADTDAIFRDVYTRYNSSYIATAYIMNISRSGLDRIGPATLTFTLPRAWAEAHGGTENVTVIRISGKDRTARILNTTYLGTDTADSLVFSAYSPEGTSLFGIITADALTRKGITPSEGQIMLDLKIIFLIAGLMADRPYLIAIGTSVILAVLYFGRRK